MPDITPHEEALVSVEESRRAFPQQPVTLEYYNTKKRRTKKRRPRQKDKNVKDQGNATP